MEVYKDKAEIPKFLGKNDIYPSLSGLMYPMAL